MITEKELSDCMNRSYENQLYIYGIEKFKQSKFYCLKHLLWLIAVLFISPLVNSTLNTIYVCYSELHMKIFNCTAEDTVICCGKYLSTFKDIRKRKSFYSIWRLNSRIINTIKSILFYFKNRDLLSLPFTYVIEYYIIYLFICEAGVEKIVCGGNFDRYATFLSLIIGKKGNEFIGIQHGIIALESIPNKVYFSEYNAIDNNEIFKMMKLNNNNDCRYCVTGFHSNIEWDILENNNKKVIAIASQDRHIDMTLSMIHYIYKMIDLRNYQIVVYPHYREDYNKYRAIKDQCPELLIFQTKRHRNIDILITFYSTIVYDFWSINQSIQVLCKKIEGFSPSYYDADNVRVFDTVENMIDYINTL